MVVLLSSHNNKPALLFLLLPLLADYNGKLVIVGFADAWSIIGNTPALAKPQRFLDRRSTNLYQQSASTTTGSDSSNTSPLTPSTITTTTPFPPPLKNNKNNSTRILLESPIFGRVARIRMPGEEQDDNDDNGNDDDDDDDDPSFVGAMGVPTFATLSPPPPPPEIKTPLHRDTTRKRGLEGALHNHGPAFVVDNVLSPSICEEMIASAESLGFGNFDCGRNHHGALQLVVDATLADQVAQALAPHIDIEQVEAVRKEMMMQGTTTTTNGCNDTDTTVTEQYEEDVDEDVRLVFQGLNRRWRLYRYAPSGNETFAPHIDAAFPPSGLSEDQTTLVWDTSEQGDEEIVSRLTVLIYLNDDFVGGETNFYRPLTMQGGNTEQIPALIASVRPNAGSVLLFPQGVGEEAVDYARKEWPTHEGSSVLSGRPKYVIRSDALFVTQEEKLLPDNELFRYDHLVRGAFLATSKVFQSEFLSHTKSLYNPHMGVENLGPFLYNFIRMTKKRKIVEIGAGYTSLWILQALRDNDDELRRIQELQRTGKCKLLDIDWIVDMELQDMLGDPARLLCVDNCEHQKETATGASAVAKSLGLESYLEFHRGDAFDLDFGDETVDALWCDFGVGSRMKDFIASAWSCIRPGGFLLCHSTITNENTRAWLDAIRQRQSKDVTGIEPDHYVELSLLEPHKKYQNSVSIIQKRISNQGDIFDEPKYSKYA